MQEKVIIIGAGGHAKVIADIIIKNNAILLGFLDDNIQKGNVVIGQYSVLGKIEDCINLHEQNPDVKFVIGIGNNFIRRKVANEYNLPYYTAIHPTAVIGMDVKIGEGTVVMANACINAKAVIGEHSIINTGAIIEHDNELENYVHISPNSALGGTVKIGECTHIGIGTVVKNNINISSDVIVGAGAVVVKNIEESGIYVGIPANKQRKDK